MKPQELFALTLGILELVNRNIFNINSAIDIARTRPKQTLLEILKPSFGLYNSLVLVKIHFYTQEGHGIRSVRLELIYFIWPDL